MSKLNDHHIQRRGAGCPIIFVNGFGCDRSVWNRISSDLATDHEVVTYDYAGIGRAGHAAYDRQRHATLHGHADDLIQICREAGLARPVVIAHSVGTLIAILAAQKEPGLFDSMILLAPSPSYLNHADFKGGFDMEDIETLLDTLDSNHFAWSRMMAPVIMGNDDRPELADNLAESFCLVDPAIARHFARVIFTADHRQDLDRFQVPALLLQCRDDALAAPDVGLYMQRHLRGSRLVQLDATGHCPHISAPGEVLSVIREYLGSAALTLAS